MKILLINRDRTKLHFINTDKLKLRLINRDTETKLDKQG